MNVVSPCTRECALGKKAYPRSHLLSQETLQLAMIKHAVVVWSEESGCNSKNEPCLHAWERPGYVDPAACQGSLKLTTHDIINYIL